MTSISQSHSRTRRLTTIGFGFIALLCARGISAQRTSPAAGVTFVTDEADAALTILRLEAAHTTPTSANWTALFASQGYQHLKEREASMGRGFDDSSFAAFLRSDSLIARFPTLSSALPRLEKTNVAGAAETALAYLPAATPLRAHLYLEIKPFPNSFVFTGRDSLPSIFLYVQTDESGAQLGNTLAHELHHIGTNAACRDAPTADSTRTSPAVRMMLEYLTAFGEGRAMLAAAGGPDVHPHAEDADSIRKRWDRDVAQAPGDIRELSTFFMDVIAGHIASADSVRRRGNSYFGVQGPWYTVGWLMASTVERELGRPALIRTICSPVDFLAQYNRAAQRSNVTNRTALPLWPSTFMDALGAIGHPAPRSP
jgi:hypothetical protein